MPTKQCRGAYPRQKRHAGPRLPFRDRELFAIGEQPTLTGECLREVAFPLGGIGTGCLSLSGSGAPVDWEIFNRPNKGYRPDYTFFHLHIRPDGSEPLYRVLEGRLQLPYQGTQRGGQTYRGFGFGPDLHYGSGLLRFADCRFSAHFPFCRVDLADEAVPVTVSLEAWSPFIPLNDEDSSLPVAVFCFSLTNVSDRPLSATVAMGLQNVVGWPAVGGSTNGWVETDGCRGVVMTTQRHPAGSPRFGSMALLTPADDVTYQLRFAETGWFAASESLVDEFGATGEFSGPRTPRQSDDGVADVAQLGLRLRLAPGETVQRTFVLAWLMPDFEKYWGDGCACGCANAVWRTYQGSRWPDAEAVARYTIANLERLERQSRLLAEHFFASTLPAHVLEAISSQLTTLRSPTVTRLPDGTLYGFEGCHATAGCCEGSCSHVWGYAQAMAYLFPKLEREMRQLGYDVCLRESDGHMQFRLPLPPGTAADHAYHAAADGQMGEVLRVYREWQICGDDEWLRALWPRVKRSLEYAWLGWDADRDGLLEGVHHNTLDIEYHGPETVCGSMYLAALRAGEAMARYLGDEATAEKYRQVFDRGRANTDDRLFNGEYYQQELAEGCEAPYQFGPGCICDQVIGQWHARMYGLGDVLDREHVCSALAAVFRHNFRDNFFEHHNPHRAFALNDDKGLLICTWPRGGRPKRSLTYAFECMTGFEYQVGAHMIYEGYLREGLSICKAIRERHDGRRRNPYNEFECGSHYARAMANYSYLLALTGFRYSAPERTLYLDPKVSRRAGRCFFSVEGAWGTVHWRHVGGKPVVTVECVVGALPVERVVWGVEGHTGWFAALVPADELATCCRTPDWNP